MTQDPRCSSQWPGIWRQWLRCHRTRCFGHCGNCGWGRVPHETVWGVGGVGPRVRNLSLTWASDVGFATLARTLWLSEPHVPTYIISWGLLVLPCKAIPL